MNKDNHQLDGRGSGDGNGSGYGYGFGFGFGDGAGAGSGFNHGSGYGSGGINALPKFTRPPDLVPRGIGSPTLHT